MDNLTTVSQGSLGLTAAIHKLTELGYTVSLPLIDNQCYDLVVEIDTFLYKVEIKTTKTKAASDNYRVEIKKVRPNRTQNVITNFDCNAVDYLFVYTSDKTCYFIPSTEITTTTIITLTDKYKEFII